MDLRQHQGPPSQASERSTRGPAARQRGWAGSPVRDERGRLGISPGGPVQSVQTADYRYRRSTDAASPSIRARAHYLDGHTAQHRHRSMQLVPRQAADYSVSRIEVATHALRALHSRSVITHQPPAPAPGLSAVVDSPRTRPQSRPATCREVVKASCVFLCILWIDSRCCAAAQTAAVATFTIAVVMEQVTVAM